MKFERNSKINRDLTFEGAYCKSSNKGSWQKTVVEGEDS